MRTPQYSSAALIDLFHQQTVASLPEVMIALGTRARRTAFRKLKELPYRTSYSHRGGYYTLDELIDFGQHGLWSFHDVRFSAAGTLLATTTAVVSAAPAGQFSEELDNLLHVGTQDALRKLVQQRKLTRQKVGGQFLYCAADGTRKAQQLSARRALVAAPGLVGPVPDADLMPDELRAAIVLFASLLDERQRRMYAGLESLKCGWGGDTRIAGLLGIDAGTVARGRKQLLTQDIERQRVRRPGGGRQPLEKKPEVTPAIEAALQHDVAGDPITGIRWTHRTTENIAAELAGLGIQVCPRTVARILKELDYRLRVNHKRVSAGSGPDRDQQFQYIAKQRMKFAHRGLPIVSIDTKKRELVGNFKNQGTTWERSPQAVNDHDFRSQADGIAIPYGVYDLRANRGFVVVGTSHDTPDFAADNLVRWWQSDGLERYPDASELLVLADSGGSNGPRIRCFKYALQTRLVDPYQLRLSVCHYPSGASKWNPIDHRLFSEISKNWAGHPLRCYQTILNHIRTTNTDTGLCVTAQLVDQEYPKGVKISDNQFDSIALERHQLQPLRNYTICPRSLARAGRKVSQNAGRFLTHPSSAEGV